MTKHNPFPVPAASDEALYGHLGRYARSIVLSAFEQMGGEARLVAWGEQNYGEFIKTLFVKVLPRPVEHTLNTESIESLLDKLDREPPKTIEGESYDVEARNVEEDAGTEHQD